MEVNEMCWCLSTLSIPVVPHGAELNRSGSHAPVAGLVVIHEILSKPCFGLMAVCTNSSSRTGSLNSRL